MVIWGSGALVMFSVNQKYWQETAVPLPWFGVLLAGYNLIDGLAAKCAALGATRYGRRPLLALVGVLPVVAYFGMAAFFGWTGILFGFVFKIGRGVLGVLFMEALNERIPSAFRATVISLSQLGLRGSFCLLGPLVGYGSTPGGSRPFCRRSASCPRSSSSACSCRWRIARRENHGQQTAHHRSPRRARESRSQTRAKRQGYRSATKRRWAGAW